MSWRMRATLFLMVAAALTLWFGLLFIISGQATP